MYVTVVVGFTLTTKISCDQQKKKKKKKPKKKRRVKNAVKKKKKAVILHGNRHITASFL